MTSLGTQDGVTTVGIDLESKGEVVRLFLTSDVHFDSRWSRRELFRKHLKDAAREGAGVVIAGDLYDAMQGRYDPRRSAPELRQEYQGREDYYDVLVEDAVRFLHPFRERLLLLTVGNHERSVMKHAGTDLLARTASRLNLGLPEERRVQVGEYVGYLVLKISTSGKPRATSVIYYAHGKGGGAPVTRGMIDTARQAAFMGNVDVVLNGHNHQGYVTMIPKEGVQVRSGKPVARAVWYLRTPGYKDEWARYRNGFVATGNAGPHPMGGLWLLGYLGADVMRWQVGTAFEA